VTPKMELRVYGTGDEQSRMLENLCLRRREMAVMKTVGIAKAS
jgi:hypothetical protein